MRLSCRALPFADNCAELPSNLPDAMWSTLLQQSPLLADALNDPWVRNGFSGMQANRVQRRGVFNVLLVLIGAAFLVKTGLLKEDEVPAPILKAENQIYSNLAAIIETKNTVDSECLVDSPWKVSTADVLRTFLCIRDPPGKVVYVCMAMLCALSNWQILENDDHTRVGMDIPLWVGTQLPKDPTPALV